MIPPPNSIPYLCTYWISISPWEKMYITHSSPEQFIQYSIRLQAGCPRNFVQFPAETRVFLPLINVQTKYGCCPSSYLILSPGVKCYWYDTEHSSTISCWGWEWMELTPPPSTMSSQCTGTNLSLPKAALMSRESCKAVRQYLEELCQIVALLHTVSLSVL